MRILYLAQRVPYPPDRGDKISSWHHIERLKRTHEVTVVAFAHDAADLAAAESLRSKGFEVHTANLGPMPARVARTALLLLSWKPLTLGYYGSRKLQALVDELIPKNDLVIAFSSSMGAFIERHESVPRVMFFAELDSDKWRQYAEHGSWPMSWIHAREHHTLRRFESRIAHAVEQNVLVTPIEESIFNRLIPGAPTTVVPNGVDRAEDGLEPSPEADHLVFVGMMNYFPNVQGCLWFVNEVLPRVQAVRPGARLSIVGANPRPAVRALATRAGVEVSGRVDDPRTWLKRAAVSVAPLHIARGIQNKVLEAMAMGVPVVGTSSATQGVGGKPDQHFLVADDAKGQADAILGLLQDPARARALGEAGRTYVQRKCDWESTLAPLEQIVEVLNHDYDDRAARTRRRR